MIDALPYWVYRALGFDENQARLAALFGHREDTMIRALAGRLPFFVVVLVVGFVVWRIARCDGELPDWGWKGIAIVVLLSIGVSALVEVWFSLTGPA